MLLRHWDCRDGASTCRKQPQKLHNPAPTIHKQSKLGENSSSPKSHCSPWNIIIAVIQKMNAHWGFQVSIVSMIQTPLKLFSCVSTELQNPGLILKMVLFLITGKHYPISRRAQSFTEFGKYTALMWKGWFWMPQTESQGFFHPAKLQVPPPTLPGTEAHPEGLSSSHSDAVKLLQLQHSGSDRPWLWQGCLVVVPVCCTKANPCSQLLLSQHGKQIPSWQGKENHCLTPGVYTCKLGLCHAVSLILGGPFSFIIKRPGSSLSLQL